RALTTDSQYETRVTGDANARWFMDTTGKQSWGPGSGAVDTNLYRSAANALTTDDSLNVGIDLGVTGNAAVTGNLTVTGNLSVTGIGRTVRARRTSDDGRTNNTIAADTQIVIPVVANAVYEIDGILFFTSASVTPDVAIQFDGPASSNGLWQSVAPPTSATTDDSTVRTVATPFATSRTYGLQTASQIFGFPVSGMLETAGTAGNFTLSWAQSTTNATPTTIKTYSWIRLSRVA
ncbi:MAG TPA: hypothetical protein VIY48_10670, partial [Candidatus Paceibacterota bacterium]